MNRLRKALAKPGRRLVTYLTGGDPSLDETTDLLRAAVEGGADIIELGVPFSDPVADGPVIQEAANRALGAGADWEGVLGSLAAFRATHETPVILFGYANPFFRRTWERAAAEAADAGADGFLVVDLPVEEAEPVRSVLDNHELELIPLVAPTTPLARMRSIVSTDPAFVYLVSVAGVTGAGMGADAAIDAQVARLRSVTSRPVLVGFGIASGEDAERVGALADGVVVGSAFIRAMAAQSERSARRDAVRELAAELRRGLDRIG